ncbi:MAG: molybdopterin molybdotransferase MoeA [Bacillota bacterium]|nr:molybdopterin molybdotransferase MoeA [Bacillota bacterium]
MQLNLKLEEARTLLLTNCRRLEKEWIPLLECNQRIAAGALSAISPLPAVSQSARDGYAINQHGDMNCFKKYTNRSHAHETQLPPGYAWEVITGETLPLDTTSVVPLEELEVKEDSIQIISHINMGTYMKLTGEDFKTGDIILSEGQVITPGIISLLAAYGLQTAPVRKKPRVSILSLGENIVPVHLEPGSREYRDSNSPLLASLVSLKQGEISNLSSAYGKSESEVQKLMLQCVEYSDLVITIGGTFSGIYEEARLLFESIGADVLFWGIPIQPGSHNGAAVLHDTLLLSLPGNPAACAVAYHLLAAPVINKLHGLDVLPELPTIKATCQSTYTKKIDARRFIRAQARCMEHGWEVLILPGQKPGMIRSLLQYNALIDLPVGHPPLQPGSPVNILLTMANNHY